MNRRGAAMLLDNLCGKSMQQIADEHGIGPQRVHQLIKKARESIGWHPGMTKQQAGAALSRRRPYYAVVGRAQTPEEFAVELRQEEELEPWRRPNGW
jgi:transposase-like protein